MVVEVEHVVVELLVENPAKDVNEDVLQEICEIVFDKDLVGKRLREYVLVEVVLEDVAEHVLLKVAVERMIAKAMLENAFKEVPKALGEYVDATKMPISMAWLEDLLINAIVDSGSNVVFKESLGHEVITCEADIEIEVVDPKTGIEVDLVQDVAVEPDFMANRVPLEVVLQKASQDI